MLKLNPCRWSRFEIGMAFVLCLLAAVLPGVSLTAGIGLVGVWIAVRICAWLLGLDSPEALRVLLGAMTALGVMMLVNLSFFCSFNGATPENPYIVNWDSSGYMGVMRGISAGVPLHWRAADTFGILMWPLWILCGLPGLLCFNVFALMAAVLFAGRIGLETAPAASAEARRMAWISMLLAVLVANFLVQGTIFQKDALSLASWTGSLAGMLALRRRLDSPSGSCPAALIVFTLVAALMCVYVRTRTAPLLLFMLLLLVPPSAFRGNMRALGCWGALLLLFGAGYWCIHTALGAGEPVALTVGHRSNFVFGPTPRTSALGGFVEAYPGLPAWQKLLWLPFTAGLQTLLPLPWTLLRHTPYGPSMVYAHMGFAWYIEAGLILYFIACVRRAPRLLSLLFCGGCAVYLATAYYFGGTVGRYALVSLPLLLPAAAWVLLNRRKSPGLRRWMAIYLAALVLSLGAGWWLYSKSPAPKDNLCVSSPASGKNISVLS